MSENEFKKLVRETIQTMLQQSGDNITFTDVVKFIITEKPELRPIIKKNVPFIKKELERIKEEWKKVRAESVAEPMGETNEYEMLIRNFVRKIETSGHLKSHIECLLVYGSYAKSVAIIGESDLNFLLVTKSKVDISKELVPIVNALKTPEVEHIFNLLVLPKENVIKSAKNGGVRFSSIHALSAKYGRVLYGENPLKNVKITNESIIAAAKQQIKLIGTQSLNFIAELSNSNDFSPEDAAYYLALDVLTLGLNVLYLVLENPATYVITRPEVQLMFEEHLSNHKIFSKHATTIQNAQAIRLGIFHVTPETFKQQTQKFVEATLEFIEN